MPLNVCDKEGRHLGFVYKAYPLDKNVLLVALTSLSIADCIIDQRRIMSFLASVYNAKTMFGKINEEQLFTAIENQLWETAGGDYKTLGVQSDEEYYRLLFLQNYSDWSKRAVFFEDFKSIVAAKLAAENALGFVLLDIRSSLRINNSSIVLDAKLDYVNQEKDGGLPLFGRIHKFPVFRQEQMHLVNAQQHQHLTIIPFLSGNAEQAIELQILAHAAKGMELQIYLQEADIQKIIAGGAIYHAGDLE